MKLRIFECRHREDFGHDLYIHFFCVYNWCLIRSCFSTLEYGCRFPYFNLIMGSGRLLGISFQFLNIGFTVEFLSRSWFK